MWLIANGGIAVNLNTCTYAEPGSTAGTARFHVPVSGSDTALTVTFGTTEAEAIAGIAKVTQAIDPAIYG